MYNAKMIRQVLIIVVLIHITTASNILVWIPTPSVSHQIIPNIVVKGLLSRGHHVTYITTNPINDPKYTNLTEVDVSYSYQLLANSGLYKWFSQQSRGIFQFCTYTILFPTLAKIWSQTALDRNVQETLKRKYDVFIGETSISPILPVFKNMLNCPVVGICSLWVSMDTSIQNGNTYNPSYETTYYRTSRKLDSFISRVINTLQVVWEAWAMEYFVMPVYHKGFREAFGASTVDLTDRRVDLILSNSHPALNGVRAQFPDDISIGGILRTIPKQLPKDLQDFLDSAKEGVVYFSLGSNVKSNLLPDEKRQILINGFAKLPYKVLWKFENDTLAGKPDNVKIQKWLPQVDVLAHPNIKVFVTQGGIQSLEETIHARVPIVGIPFFGDQFWNIDHMTNLGIGVSLDKDSITADNFVAAIEEVARNDKYQKKVNEVGDLLEDSPIPPLEKAMYWIEYVIRHKGTKLSQSPKIGMSWFQYLCFDVLLFFLAVFVVLLSLTVYSIFVLYKFTKRIFATKKVKRS